MDDDLIPLADLTDYFRRSRRTLSRWAEARVIPTERIGSAVYMRRADLEHYAHPVAKLRAEVATREAEGVTILDAETALLMARACREAAKALSQYGAAVKRIGA